MASTPDNLSATRPLVGPLATGLLIVTCLALIGWVTLYLWWPAERMPAGKALIDFQIFHIAGQLAWTGDLATAYDMQSFWDHTRAVTKRPNLMFWPYPPHFNLFSALLAVPPLWLSYLLFAVGSLIFYLLMLRRLAAAQFGTALALLLPAILICLSIGQNGLLIGGLVGWFASLAVTGRPLAGVPLGLLTVKPQFLPGIGLYLLVRGHWRIILAGGLVAGLALAAATLLFGLDVWPAFLHVTGQASQFLLDGRYKLFRMTSLYAALYAALGDPSLAMAAQAAFAVALAGGLLLAARRGWPPRQLLAAAIMAGILMSPYGYDYDLPIAGAAVALLLPDLNRQPRWIGLPLLLLAWLACLAGSLTRIVTPAGPMPAVQFVPVLLLFATLLLLARRAPADG